MKHQVKILNFSISLGEGVDEVEKEMARLLDQGYKIATATGYSIGQSGPHHGGAFVFMIRQMDDGATDATAGS